MVVITTPVTTGLITLPSFSIKKLINISTKAAKKHTAKMVASTSSFPPPVAFTVKPVAKIVPKNAKLVPCTQISPEPIGPTRRA
jgi:hypothetical protein